MPSSSKKPVPPFEMLDAVVMKDGRTGTILGIADHFKSEREFNVRYRIGADVHQTWVRGSDLKHA